MSNENLNEQLDFAAMKPAEKIEFLSGLVDSEQWDLDAVVEHVDGSETLEELYGALKEKAIGIPANGGERQVILRNSAGSVDYFALNFADEAEESGYKLSTIGVDKLISAIEQASSRWNDEYEAALDEICEDGPFRNKIRALIDAEREGK